MLQANAGAKLFLVSLLLSLSGCRGSTPPEFKEICTLDGFGGGDCSLPGGERKYHPPSEMRNYWATDQESMKNFASWCYRVPPEQVPTNPTELRALIQQARLEAERDEPYE